MSTKDYNTYIKLLKGYIYQNSPITYVDFLQRLKQLTIGNQNRLFVDMICNQLSGAFIHKTSQIVNKATIILSQLVIGASEQLTLRMAQKQFQDNMYYTLRRKTSVFGNRFTMHPLMWDQIQNRVLKIYQYWFKQFMMEEQKYRNILQNYRTLKSMKIQFPNQQIFPVINPPIIKKNQQIKKIQIQPKIQSQQSYKQKIIIPLEGEVKQKSGVNKLPINQEIQIIQQLIIKYQNQIQKQQWGKIFNDQTVRLLKSKSLYLYNTFNQKSLSQQIKTKVKNYYSRMRTLLKKIDQRNDKMKLEDQKKFIESKMGLIKTNSSGGKDTKNSNNNIKIQTPTKLGQKKQQNISPLSQNKKQTNNNQINLLDIDNVQPQIINKISSPQKNQAANNKIYELLDQATNNNDKFPISIQNSNQILQKTQENKAQLLFSWDDIAPSTKKQYSTPKKQQIKHQFDIFAQNNKINQKQSFNLIQNVPINLQNSPINYNTNSPISSPQKKYSDLVINKKMVSPIIQPKIQQKSFKKSESSSNQSPIQYQKKVKLSDSEQEEDDQFTGYQGYDTKQKLNENQSQKASEKLQQKQQKQWNTPQKSKKSEMTENDNSLQIFEKQLGGSGIKLSKKIKQIHDVSPQAKLSNALIDPIISAKIKQNQNNFKQNIFIQIEQIGKPSNKIIQIPEDLLF